MLRPIGRLQARVGGGDGSAQRTASRRSRPAARRSPARRSRSSATGARSSSPTASPTKSRRASQINYVFSYQASGIPLFSPQYTAGFDTGCKMGKAIYPLDCAAIAPVQTDPNQQVSQIEAKLAAGEIDCIGDRAGDLRLDDGDHEQADGSGHSGLHRRRHFARA